MERRMLVKLIALTGLDEVVYCEACGVVPLEDDNDKYCDGCVEDMLNWWAARYEEQALADRGLY